VAFNHRQPLANTYAQTYTPNENTSLIRRLPLEDYTRAGVGLRLVAKIDPPEPGYGGLTIGNPYAGLTFEVDARKLDKSNNDYFRVYKLEAGFDINIYDGRPFIDTFERQLALPIVTLSPFARYDFAYVVNGYQLGQFGADITVYTASLGFTLNVSYETRTLANGAAAAGGGFGFGFGFKLR
jgi:hypothetical protein